MSHVVSGEQRGHSIKLQTADAYYHKATTIINEWALKSNYIEHNVFITYWKAQGKQCREETTHLKLKECNVSVKNIHNAT